MNTELRLDHNITSSNKHGKSAKDNRFTDLVKLLDMPETASGSNVQSMKSTCYRNLTWQNKAWQYSTKCIWQKSLTDHKPKRTRRYDGKHVNIGESKWGAVFAHTIVIERPRAWKRVWWVLGWFWRGFLLDTQMDFADARLTFGVPNDLQMERNLTGRLRVVY